MIRSFLLGTATAVALFAASPAHALFGAGDIVFDPTNLATASQSLTQLENSYRQLGTIYSQVTNVYGALAHPTSATAIGSALSSVGVQTPLAQFGNIQNSLAGLTNGNVSGAVSALRQANQYFAPTGNDFAATNMAQQATGVANIQAMAMANLQALQDRATGLQTLTAKIDSGDITDMTALSNRFHSEAQFLAVQQAQATNMQTLLMAQSQVTDQRVSQKQRQDAEALINCTSTAAAAMGVASFGSGATPALTQSSSTAPAPSVPVFGANGS